MFMILPITLANSLIINHSNPMNQDSSYDPLDFDIPLPDHFHDDAHYLASSDPIDFHHSEDLATFADLHSSPFDPFDHGPFVGTEHPPDLPPHVIGESGSGREWHQQQTPFTCAVVSQEMILREFGIDVNEAHLMGDAMQNGWLSNAGTPFEDMGKLLELHGVPCHDGQGIDQLVSELSQGHKVIVGVDSTDLWQGDSWIAKELHEMVAGGPHADHAIVVQGLRKDDDGSWHVIVNDPGSPNGEGHDYPLDQFTDAWKGSDFHFVSTAIAPQGLSSHPVYGAGFDEQSGSYTGVMDWLNTHSSALHAAGFGALLMVKSVGSSSREKTEQERNDLLRKI